MFGKAGVSGAGGDGGFGERRLRRLLRHLRRLLRRGRWRRLAPRGAAADRLGPALRPADHVRRRPSSGPRRRSSSRSSAGARRARGPAPSRARRPSQCPQCKGRGEIRSVRQTMLGQMVNVVRVPALPRRGQDRRDARARRAAARAAPSASARFGWRSRPASTRATRSGSRTRARSGPAAARRAASTSPSTWRRTRRSPARAPSSTTRPTCRSRRRRSGTKIKVPTVEGEDAEVEIKPGTQPGTEIRLRGRGVPHLRRQSVRGDLHVIANVVVPTKLTQAPARAARGSTRRRAARPSHPHGGLREKLGLG